MKKAPVSTAGKLIANLIQFANFPISPESDVLLLAAIDAQETAERGEDVVFAGLPDAEPIPTDFTGTLISFEGGDGAGKTTQIARLAEALHATGMTTRSLREPGGTAAGEGIRDILKTPASNFALCPLAELLLFSASRAQLIREVMVPALTNGEVVICDRFFDSTTIYQGARGIARPVLDAVTKFAVGGCNANVTFLLDISIDAAAERMGRRRSDVPRPFNNGAARARTEPEPEVDRFESAGDVFANAVRNGFLALSDEFPERIRVIDASRPSEGVHAQVWKEAVAMGNVIVPDARRTILPGPGHLYPDHRRELPGSGVVDRVA